MKLGRDQSPAGDGTKVPGGQARGRSHGDTVSAATAAQASPTPPAAITGIRPWAGIWV